LERVNRSGRAILAFASGTAFSVVGMAAAFFVTPRLINLLGLERFGVSRALLDLFAYVALLEFGLAGAARATLAAAVAAPDQSRVPGVLHTVLGSFFRTTLWKALGAVLLACAAPWLIGGARRGLMIETLVAALMLTLGVATTTASALQALLSVQQRDYLSNAIYGVQNLLVLAFSLVLAWLGAKIPGQTAAFVLASFVTAGCLFAANRRLVLAALRSEDVQARADSARELSRLNRPTFIRAICGQVALRSDRLYIAFFLAGEVVSRFYVTVRLVDLAVPFLFSIGNSIWPAMASMHKRGEHELFVKRLLETTTLISVGGILLLGPALVVNEWFVTLWTGKQLFSGWAITVLAVINAILLAHVSSWDWCFGATGKVPVLIPATLASAAVNVPISIFGTKFLGPIGPLLGTTLAMGGVMLVWEARLMREHFGVSAARLLVALVKPLLWGVAYLLIVRLAVTRLVHAPSWFAVVGVTIGLTSGWAIFAWSLLIDADSRALWRARLSRISTR
jgi:O-antigen/teichoic acid export membrane protein